MSLPLGTVEFAAAFEGLRLASYRDAAGYPTIGYGHLLTRDRALPLSTWPPITEIEAHGLLMADLARSWASVRRLCPTISLTEGQATALIDFCYNLGSGQLQASTLRAKVNRGDPSAVDEFARWAYAGGVKLPGLVRRRAVEAAMFQQGV